MPPTRLRRKATEGAAAIAGSQTSTLQLSYRPPYDWKGLLAFLAARALAGRRARDGRLLCEDRAARERRQGWIRVTQVEEDSTRCWSSSRTRLTPVLPALLSRVRALFDLDARPDLIAKHLGRDARLAAAVKANPGMRVPGAFNGFEMGLRAILGQQVTVKAATTIAGRFVEAFGEPIVTPFAELNRLTPAAGARRRGQRRRHRPTRHRRRARAGASSRWRRRRDQAGSASTAARITIRTTPSGGWRSCPGSARGRRTTLRCGPCAGPTPSPRKTSRCATTSAGSRRRRRRRCRNPGARGEATRSCTSGAWRRRPL